LSGATRSRTRKSKGNFRTEPNVPKGNSLGGGWGELAVADSAKGEELGTQRFSEEIHLKKKKGSGFG